MKNIFITGILFLLYTTVINAQTDSLTVNVKKSCWEKTETVLSIAVPSAMVTYGIISSLGNNSIRQLDYDVRNSMIERHIKADDYLQFAPAVAALGMNICGVESRHNLMDMAILYALSNVLNLGVVHVSKRITDRERPDGSNNHSFPSGHTSAAFVSAEFLYQEYKDKSIWIGVGGYAVASFVGAARIYNNKHWLSDVIAGAGVGILTTKAVYWLYPYMQQLFCSKNTGGKSKGTTQALLFPSYDQQCLSLNFSCTF